MAIPANLIVFDTCAVEGKYLLPILRGERLLDMERLRALQPHYSPAISIKTLFELFAHLKRGVRGDSSPNQSFGYPGGIDERKRILNQSERFSGDVNEEYFYRLSEEWMCRDWAEHRDTGLSFIKPSEHEGWRQDVKVQREYTDWKRKMTEFLACVSHRIEREFFVIERHLVYGLSSQEANAALQLERDLAMNTLYPSEDFEILVSALILDAVALVTADDTLMRAGLSVPPDHRTSFVHPDRLWDAVNSGFGVRIYDRTSGEEQQRKAR